MRRKDTPGMLLQIARARAEFIDYLQRWEFEIVAESTPRHLKNVGTAAKLLLEKLIRIQRHETLETREYEMKLAALEIRSKRLWEPAPEETTVRRLSLVPRMS